MGQSGYIAACVRARAKKNGLLTHEEWLSLSRMGDAPEVMAWLRQRGLAEFDGPIEKVERALRAHNIRLAASLSRFLSGTGADAVNCFVRYYDLLNVETVISNLHTGGDTGGIAPFLFDTGRAGMVDKELLTAVGSFPALGNLLRGTVLYDVYRRALEQYERDGEVARFTAALELEFLRGWYRAVRRVRGNGRSAFDSFIKIKAADAMLRLRFRRDSSEHEVAQWNRLVPGGLLGSDFERWYAVSDFKEAAGYLEQRIFGGNAGADDAEVDVETRMQRRLLADVMREQHRNGFSLDYLFSFLLRFMLQTEDLVRLLECKDFNLEPERLDEYLVGVI